LGRYRLLHDCCAPATARPSTAKVRAFRWSERDRMARQSEQVHGAFDRCAISLAGIPSVNSTRGEGAARSGRSCTISRARVHNHRVRLRGVTGINPSPTIGNANCAGSAVHRRRTLPSVTPHIRAGCRPIQQLRQALKDSHKQVARGKAEQDGRARPMS